MKPVSENEMFVNLIRVAKEDPSVREKLCGILRHRPYQRAGVIHYYMAQMKKAGAPEEFTAAVACLLEDEVAEKALSLLCADSGAPGIKKR